MKIGIIGDYRPEYPSQKATNDAMRHSSAKSGIQVDYQWIPTQSIPEHFSVITSNYDGYWIAPGSPESITGVLAMITYAREQHVPLLGTCGGFQHMILEYARSILSIEDAAHEEQSPDASKLLISRLACSLVGQQGEVQISPCSKAYRIYQTPKTIEHFRCNYGLNANYQNQIEQSGLKIVGTDQLGEPRIIEIPKHPFFIGTLFVPQLSSTFETPHCLVDAFIEQACIHAGEINRN
ncbi:glutamine amidotransferase-related protein [Paenibacillus qinlingensis]|uniref:CTP synthase (glutamine hydrolyzing) n=1 Tax=Paenibacillus qinlingensis TaxID=1837343 RepID=A0ABU1NTE1_9BACL|nr:hypothetical protein [Paenibacillus qinlingensis]MDR6550132.1 CTP synthase (UTP-ammonia lyase) [Paenibacillus qinlingensis]